MRVGNIANLFFYKWSSYLRGSNRSKKSLAILKIDEIGDYILFRNFLKSLKESQQYKDFHITLIGNVAWKTLAMKLDGDVVDNFIWLDLKKYDDRSYRKSVYAMLAMESFSELLVYHYSRTLTTETIAFMVKAKKKRAMTDDYSSIGKRARKFFDFFYTQLVFIPNDVEHEFDKNKYFFKTITGSNYEHDLPEISWKSNDVTSELAPQEMFVVVAPGAGVERRRLPVLKWHSIVDDFLRKGYFICIVGSDSERAIAQSILKPFQPSSKLIDLTGKTTLDIVPAILKKSKLVLCNESSIYHISVALGLTVKCFAGGGHFKRYAKYKQAGSKIEVIHHQMDCYNCNWNCIYPLDDSINSYPCIQSIEVEDWIGKNTTA